MFFSFADVDKCREQLTQKTKERVQEKLKISNAYVSFSEHNSHLNQNRQCSQCLTLQDKITKLQQECQTLTEINSESNQALFEMNMKLKKDSKSRIKDTTEFASSFRDLQEKYKRMENDYKELTDEVKHLTSANGSLEDQLQSAKAEIASLKDVNRLLVKQGLFNKEVEDLKVQLQMWKQAASQYQTDFNHERKRCNQIANKLSDLEEKIQKNKGEKPREYEGQIVDLSGGIRLVNFQAEEILRTLIEMENKLNSFDPHSDIRRLLFSIGLNVKQLRSFAQATKQCTKKYL